MSNISAVSLHDTYRLIQLARETALVQGKGDQAKRLSPIVDEMKELVKPSAQPTAAPAPAGGLLQQSDFQKLLEVSRTRTQDSPVMSTQSNVNSVMERNRMVMAMSSANMGDVEIARQMGMTRDEVRMVVSVNRFAYSQYAKGASL